MSHQELLKISFQDGAILAAVITDLSIDVSFAKTSSPTANRVN